MVLARKILFLWPLFLLLALQGCYHMRVLVEPIDPIKIVVKVAPAEALRRIKNVLDEKQHLRNLEEQSDSVLITSPWHFATDTGFGQPAGGRKYYTQLRIETAQKDGQTEISISPYHYEIRTTYAYGLDGQVKTLAKTYPYEEYPGMFDLKTLKRELNGVAALIKSEFHE